MTVFDQTLFRAVPRLYRATEATLVGDASGSVPTPVPAFVTFGSWVGGDRDGNPFVTADVTRQAVATHAEHALRWLSDSALRIARTMTLDEGDTPASRELVESLAADAVSSPARFSEIALGSPGEPHRQKMLVIAERVRATRDGRTEHSYASPEALRADLRMVQRSLQDAGAIRAANGELQHLIWGVDTFGFHLVELEVRQHSRVHRAALIDLIGQLPSVGDAAALADDAAFLDGLATDGWPAYVEPRDDGTREVLDTFRVMSWLQQRWGARCCGPYVVSFSQSAAHLAAVRALARLAVGDAPLRLDVVPLFETGADLDAAVATLDSWLPLRSTQQWLLSDRPRRWRSCSATRTPPRTSARPAPPSTWPARRASWSSGRTAPTCSSPSSTAEADPSDVVAVRFIARSRPSRPARSNGRLKVTEQGEVVFARYADTTLAQRHLERLTTAVLLADTRERRRAQRRGGDALRRPGCAGRAGIAGVLPRTRRDPRVRRRLRGRQPARGDRRPPARVAAGPQERCRQRSRPRRPAGDPLGLRVGADPGQHPRLVRPRLRARVRRRRRDAARRLPRLAAVRCAHRRRRDEPGQDPPRAGSRVPLPRRPSRHHRAHPCGAGPHHRGRSSACCSSRSCWSTSAPFARAVTLRAPVRRRPVAASAAGAHRAARRPARWTARRPARPGRSGAGCCCSRSTAQPPACRTPGEPSLPVLFP